MFIPEQNKLRHKILELLIRKSDENRSNDEVTIEEVTEYTNSTKEKIEPQLEVLLDKDHIYVVENRYAVIASGRIAFYKKDHLNEGKDFLFKKYDRFFKYIALPLGLILTISSVFELCNSNQNTNNIKEIQQSIERLEKKQQIHPNQIDSSETKEKIDTILK